MLSEKIQDQDGESRLVSCLCLFYEFMRNVSRWTKNSTWNCLTLNMNHKGHLLYCTYSSYTGKGLTRHIRHSDNTILPHPSIYVLSPLPGQTFPTLPVTRSQHVGQSEPFPDTLPWYSLMVFLIEVSWHVMVTSRSYQDKITSVEETKRRHDVYKFKLAPYSCCFTSVITRHVFNVQVHTCASACEPVEALEKNITVQTQKISQILTVSPSPSTWPCT